MGADLWGEAVPGWVVAVAEVLGVALAGLSLLVTVVAASVALWQLRLYIREQEERARPYLMVDFWFKANSSLYITLENISSTPATDVTMRSNPLPLSGGRDAEYDAALAEVFGGVLVIPQVAPGAVMRWYIDEAHALLPDRTRPHRFEVTVEYTDPRARVSRSGSRKRYADPPFILDLAAFGFASGGNDYESKNWNIAVRNEARFEEMKKSLRSVAATLDTLLGIEDADKAARRRGPMLERRRRRRRREWSTGGQ